MCGGVRTWVYSLGLGLCAGVAFGAPASGLTQAHIQRQIDALPPAGGVVRLAPGEYAVTRPILLRNGVRILGAGAHTVLRVHPDLRGPVFTNRDWQNGGANIEIGALTLDGSADRRPVSQHGSGRRAYARAPAEVEDVAVYLRLVKNARLHRLLIRNFRNEAILLIRCERITVAENGVTDSARKANVNDWSQGAIYLRYTSGCVITNNTLAGCYEGGIVAGLASHENHIARNAVTNSASGEGVFIGGGDRNVVVDNLIEDVSHADLGTGAGIAVSVPPGLDAARIQARGNLVARNIIRKTGGSGIALHRAEESRVVGNTISAANQNQKAGRGGVSAFESGAVVITGNTISQCRCPGIVVRRSKDAVVRGNRLAGNTSPQISIEGLSREAAEAANALQP